MTDRRDQAIQTLTNALTAIINAVEPKVGEYDGREATLILVVALAEHAIGQTADVHDEACREDSRA